VGNYGIHYHMSYRLTRTSMALDENTISALAELATRWATSKAEVIRRAVQQAKSQDDRSLNKADPLDALRWLQSGGGYTPAQANVLREELQQERQAARGWWEEA
jgi:hypothetical protein